MDTLKPRPESVENTSKNIPPFLRKRNDFGLVEGIDYVFNEDGTINWRKMIKPEFLVPHKQVFEKRNKPVPESIEGLDDKELLILLGGIKDLAQIRGYTNVQHTVTSPSNDCVISVCSILWIPNYETEGRSVEFSDIGDATLTNSTGFGKNYLGPIAANRAFVRCVRNFLKINIVSQEEIGGNFGGSDTQESLGATLLRQTMTQYNITFDAIKKRLIKDKLEGAENLTSIEDIPAFKKFELISKIKERAAELEAKKS